MKTLRKTLFATAATLTLAAAPVGFSATTLFDYTFDGVANDVGPAVQVVENNTDVSVTVSGTPTVATPGSANTSTGLITAGSNNHPSNAGSRNNHAIGFNSSATVSLAGFNSITATFVIDSITLNLAEGANVVDLLNNGMFFGVVGGTNATSSTGLWNADPAAFGYVPGSASKGDHVVARNAGSNTHTNDSIASAQPSNASLIDGFTVSLTVNDDDTWSVSSTGLSTELSDNGSITGLWADFSGGVGLYAGFQGNAGGQLDMNRMTLTAIPEPSGAVLTGAFGTLLLLRRRRF